MFDGKHDLLEMDGEDALVDRELIMCDDKIIDQICTQVLDDMMTDLETIFDDEDSSGQSENDFGSDDDLHQITHHEIAESNIFAVDGSGCVWIAGVEGRSGSEKQPNAVVIAQADAAHDTADSGDNPTTVVYLKSPFRQSLSMPSFVVLQGHTETMRMQRPSAASCCLSSSIAFSERRNPLLLGQQRPVRR